MYIRIKKNGYLTYKKLKFRCAFGKSGINSLKIEGDKSSPRGVFSLGFLYFRKDRIKKIETNMKKKIIKQNTGWCNNKNHKNYNKEISFDLKKNAERMFRKDYKYNMLIVINYNTNPVISGKGSAIFIHLTKNYKPTAGCIAVNQNDFLKLASVIKRSTKIKIG